MFRAVLEDDDITQDECDQRFHAGGIVPPQCLELETFRDWHEKDTQELLAESVPAEDSAQAVPQASSEKHDTAFAVDEFGGTLAFSISADLMHLENQISQLIVSDRAHFSSHVEVKDAQTSHADAPANVSSDTPALDETRERLKELMQHELGEHQPAENEGPKTVLGDFNAFHTKMEARHKKRVAHRAALMREISQKMGNLDMKLSDVVSDRKAWEETLLEKYDTAGIAGHNHAEPDVSPQSTFMAKRLQWSAVPTVRHQKAKSPQFLETLHKGPLVVSKSEVRHLSWTGNLPKVAAIAWIQGGRKTRARMMYFVDNFKLQDYEGGKQLVLVYHYKDTAAAQIVSKYINDTDVKGVAAHDFSQESFPSDPALRYAAWDSNADVVAQWDFDEWHDPSRLSLQVRAMAHTSKQACVLSTSSTSHSQEDEVKEISVVSLVGEKSWMKDHWHPFSRRKVEVNDTFTAGELVEMDMQNKKLMDSVSRIEHVFTEAKKPTSAATSASTLAPTPAPNQHGQSSSEEREEEGEAEKVSHDFSRGITECLDYDKSSAGDRTAEIAAEEALRENVGEDFGKKFHGLVKRRHDVTQKLQLLCFQTTMEKDHRKWKFMHEHVLEMDHIRSELDKHIKSMASLFSTDKPQ